MIELEPERIAAACGAEIARRGADRRPQRAEVDSRRVAAGDLFIGLRGERVDGGEFAGEALAAGAWGALVTPEHRERALAGPDGWVLVTEDPLAGLQGLARAWRRELGCKVVGITGSTGKTSAKDITRALLPFRVHASPENFNTEVGLPLAVLQAPGDTEVMVLEMAMRGQRQIAELCAIAEPDVGAITNVGPVHLELLGTLEAIAAAKAEILAGLREGGRAVVPADAEALEPHLGDELPTLTFGPGGDVFARSHEVVGDAMRAQVVTPAGQQEFEFPFSQEHNLRNALCAIAIGVSLEADLALMASRTSRISFSRLRGERLELAGGITVINDCYNANPISMRAALDHLATLPASRRVAVLGGMAELGPDGPAYHREIGAHARGLGVKPIIGVGELARDYAPDEWAPTPAEAVPLVDELLRRGDAVLVKGSRSVGLEAFTEGLAARRGARTGDADHANA